MQRVHGALRLLRARRRSTSRPSERGRSGVRVAGRAGFVRRRPSDSVDVGRVAIGQGGLLATPLQMAMVASAVANDGTLMKPTLTDRVVDPDGRTVEDDRARRDRREVMKESTAREVGDMMANVVREGTGTAAALVGHPGRRQDRHRGDRPRARHQPAVVHRASRRASNPRVAIAVTIERSQGGQGGTVAAPDRQAGPRGAARMSGDRPGHGRRRPLPHRQPHRLGRHGRRVVRRGPAARAPGRAEAAAPPLRRGPGVRRALPPRGVGRRRAAAPERRLGLRPRRVGRHVLHRDGVPRGRDAQGPRRARGAARPRAARST